MSKCLGIEDIQKHRYDVGCVVFNTNNYTFGIVINGKLGSDSDPSSTIIEEGMDGFIINTPPNRALIPTGRFVDFSKIIKHIKLEG